MIESLPDVVLLATEGLNSWAFTDSRLPKAGAGSEQGLVQGRIQHYDCLPSWSE